MLCLNPTKPLSLFYSQLQYCSPFLNQNQQPPPPPRLLHLRNLKPTTTTLSVVAAAAGTGSAASSTPSNNTVYQPFRPPPSSVPSQFSSLGTDGRLEVLQNRLGLWFEYAPLIPSLFQEGFTPSTIEEVTGVSGVEQNRIVVAAKVRDSLVQSNLDPETLSFFDNGGAELLYEIRLLNAAQRASASVYIVQNRLDARGAQELARAMKDFPRRRGEQRWESFTYSSPADCLSFMYFRQSREHRESEQRKSTLERALEVAETENAKRTILDELEVKSDKGEGREGELAVKTRVPVVRLKIGEVAEATSVVVLPVCEAGEGERAVMEAPGECRSEGEFGVVVADKGWSKWVALPGWEPIVGLGKGGVVVVAFGDARALPWKVNRWYKEESILVLADREKKEVEAEDGFFLVSSGADVHGGLKVERGSALKELGVKQCLGSVVLVVRPPKEKTDDQLQDDDWE